MLPSSPFGQLLMYLDLDPKTWPLPCVALMNIFFYEDMWLYLLLVDWSRPKS